MSFLSLLRVETGRLLNSRLIWAGILLTAITPLAGLFIYRPIVSISAYSYTTSLNGTVIGNPALAGALFGAVIFAFLTAKTLDNRQRFRTEAITDAVHSAFSINCAQTLSLLLPVVLTQTVTLIIWLPYSVIQLGSIFSLKLYISLYLSIMLSAVGFAVLFTAAAYQMTRRFDLSLVLFGVFVLLSLTAWQENWLLRWVNPSLSYISDDFGNSRKILSICYNRLFWVLVLSGAWALSFLCVRRYGKNLAGSLLCNLRRVYIPVIAALLILSGGYSYAAQPFLDHSPELQEDDSYFYSAEAESDGVICSRFHVDARPDLSAGSFFAAASYSLRNTTGKGQTISFTINPGYIISTATANGQPVTVRDLADDKDNEKTVEVDLPADENIELVLEYGGFPREWNILELDQGSIEISSEYIYLANTDFAPMDLLNYDENVPFTANIDLPEGMVPVLFGMGTVEKLSVNADGTVNWLLTDRYSMILYAGDYVSHHINAAGIDVEFFYSQKHSRIMEENDVDSVIKNVFEFCTKKFGPLSFIGDDTMKLIEIGSWGGGYAGSGASVMGEDSFNEQALSDPLKGAGGGEVLAHEIIHQWWGLGNMFAVSEEDNLWSSEGLTVYTTYRLMKELYGEDYAVKNYVDVWQQQVDNYYDNFYIRNPQYFDALPEKYQADILNSVTQMRQYCEMPLMLLKAEELVGGEEAFDNILYDMFNREYNEDYSNLELSYEIFLEYCGLTKEDLRLG